MKETRKVERIEREKERDREIEREGELMRVKKENDQNGRKDNNGVSL